MLEVKTEKRIQRRKKPQFGRRTLRPETDSGELNEKRSKIEFSDSEEEMEGIDFKRKSNKRRRIAREKRRERRTQNSSETGSETEEGSDDSNDVDEVKRVKRVAVSGSGESSDESTESDSPG